MAEYKGIKGFKTQSLAADPTPLVEGQLWYNTTTDALKFGANVGAWSAGNDMNIGKMESFGTGPATAAMACNGTPDGSDGAEIYKTEEYNGTSWSEEADTDQRRQDGASSGIQTSALVSAGYTTSPRGNSPWVESYNGTVWAEETTIGTTAQGRRGFGLTETTAMVGSAAPTVDTETWNGTSWTQLNDQNTARNGQGTFGTNTAGISAAGTPTGGEDEVESWNGTNWTIVNSVNTARSYLAAAGIQTNGLIYGGNTPPSVANTEAFDGTSWTEVADLGTATYYGSGGGTGAAAIMAGGNPAGLATTQDWALAVTAKTVTVS